MIVSHSPAQTRALGQRLGHACKGGEVLLLEGDLGAGKTCLAKGIAEALGLDADRITSPTFTLMQVHHGRLPMYHIDLYRIDNPDEIAHLGLFDEMDGPGVTLVEWPHLGGCHTPRHGLRIRIDPVENTGDDSGENAGANPGDGTDDEMNGDHIRRITLSLDGDGPAHLLSAASGRS